MRDCLLTHAHIFTPQEELNSGFLLIRNGRIEAVGEGDLDITGIEAQTIDVGGAILTPGFIDSHTHGGQGHDFMDPSIEAITAILRWLPSTGVTHVQATVASSPIDEQARILDRLVQVHSETPAGARMIGIHLEGPFINLEKRGAQPEHAIRPPSMAEIQQDVSSAQRLIHQVTLAPELPGALDVISFLHSNGIVASAGHTQATYEQMLAGIEAGVRRASHTFNGMPPFHHRKPGVVGAVLTHDEVYAEVILDGHHLHPAAVQVVLRAKGIDRTVLMTDANQAAGLGDGTYTRPGDRHMTVEDGVARLPNGKLAGSVLTMDRAVANAVHLLGLPLKDALRMATDVAAESLGLGDTLGKLAAGRAANLVLMSEGLDVLMAMIDGDVVFGTPQWSRLASDN